MREFGTLPKEIDPQVFLDHLLSLGVTTRFEARPEVWALWVYNEDHLAQARAELDAFRADPTVARYRDAPGRAKAVLREREKSDKTYRKNFVEVRERWAAPGPRQIPVTSALIALSILVALLTDLGASRGPIFRVLTLSTLARDADGQLVWMGLDAVVQGEVWRLVTPIFLHFSIMHVLMNMWVLRDFGGMIESRRGTARLAVLVVVAAVVSDLGQFYLGRSPLFGGMSGVNFALFGYIWMKTLYQPDQGLWLHPNTVVFLLAWFVLCMTGYVGPIANAAHGVGLTCGIVFGLARF